ncbi:MAG: hypothetical protein WA609_18700 [Terriglobales bacterium]
MPTRKSVWLYDYDLVKFRTPLQWWLSLAAGIVLATIASVGLWGEIIRYRSGRGVDGALLPLSAMCMAVAIIELPAALVYFYRRRKGELTGYFDYEIVDDENAGNKVFRRPDPH